VELRSNREIEMYLFLTFTTYGTWLHGDPRGSYVVEENHSVYIAENPALLKCRENNLSQPPVVLSETEREIVFNSIVNTCRICKYELFAINVRGCHIHLIIRTDKQGRKVMQKLKMYASKDLKLAGFVYDKYWTRHGNIVELHKYENMISKACYVLFEQGKSEQSYCNENIYETCLTYINSR